MSSFKIVKGLSPMRCPQCAGFQLTQVDWVPVHYRVVGIDPDGAIIVSVLRDEVVMDWEGFDRERQELVCKRCGHRWPVPAEQDIRPRESD